jgi:glycogen operon protein
MLDEDDQRLLAFTQSLVRLRREHPVFRRRRFFAGSADHGGESPLGDIAWLTPEAQHMDDEAWSDGMAKSLMVFLNGSAIPEPDPRGQQILDDSFLVMFNAHHEPLTFTLPDEEYGAAWVPVIDTALHEVEDTKLEPTWQIQVQPRSIVVLRCPRETGSPIVPGLSEELTA